jgi:glutamine amidotransferase
VNYGLGNLRSVEKAVEKVGGSPRIIEDEEGLRWADAIILPGVGAFHSAQAKLMSLEPVILNYINIGVPILGICLGLQLLFTESTEGGLYKGLDIFKGRVVRFPKGLKVPHMGWNTITIVNDSCPLVYGLKSGIYMYFVHSYYGELEDLREIVAETEYGVRFPSIVSKKSVYATQFHPEKSGEFGLRILSNFLNIAKR